MLKRLALCLLLAWPTAAIADPTDSVDDAVDVINLQVSSLNAMADRIEAALADPTIYLLGDPLTPAGLIVVTRKDVDQFVGYLQVVNLMSPGQVDKSVPLAASAVGMPAPAVDAILKNRATVLATGGATAAYAEMAKLDAPVRKAMQKSLKEIYKQVGVLEAKSAALQGGERWPPSPDAAPAPAPAPVPAPAPAPVSQVFSPAMVGGIVVDACWIFGANCGQPAADQFCMTQGFTAAVSFQVAPFRPTLILGAGQMCNEVYCNGLMSVTCQK